MGQRGRAAAIYLELRQIDARAVQQLAREIETARRHVREGEERIARKRQPLAAYRFGGLECMLLGPGEGGLMSMIG